MISFIRPTELACLILHIKAKDEQQFDGLPNNYRSFFEGKSFSFPIISNSELKSIQKMMKEDSKNNLQLSDIINGLSSLKTIYDSKIVADLCPNGSLFSKSPDYAAAILLHLFLAFFKERNCDQNYLPLFNAFVAILNYSKPLKYIQKSKSIVVSSFIYLFDYIFAKKLITKPEDYSNLFVPLVQLLSSSNELPSESFELIIKLAHNLIKPTDNKLSDVAASFLNFITAIMRSCGNRFPSEIASRMISLLRMALVGLDNSALLFFSRSISNIGVEEAMTIILAFPDALVTTLENANRTEKKKSIDPIILSGEELPILPQKATQVFFSPTENSLLPDDLLSQPKPRIPGTQINFNSSGVEKIDTFFHFIPKEIESKCVSISKIVESSNDMKFSLISLIFNKISNINNQPHNAQLLPALLTLLIYLSPIPSDIIIGLFNLNFIYDQRVTFSTEPLPSYYEYLTTVRSCLSVLLMKQEQKIIEEVYEIMRTKPFLFQDFACRIVPYFIQRNVFKLSFEAVAISVASASFYYKAMTAKSDNELKLDSKLNQVLIKNRICCFQILGEIFDNQKYLSVLLSSSQFVPSVIGFLFEEPTRKFILKYLNQYFQMKESENNTDLITDFIKIITTAMKESYTPFAFKFLIDLTHFLDVTITNNSDVSKAFEPVIPTICEWIVNMPKCNDGITVLIQTISMFSAFFSSHKITQSEVSALETAAKNMYGGKSSVELEKQLICLIFAHSKSGIEYKDDEFLNKYYLIKQPKALKLLLTLFYNKETINFLINLCKFSPINSYVCRSAQLDVFVLEKLFNLRTTDNVNTFELLLKLFSEIGRVNSAVSVVNQYISLFTAINGKFISRYQLMLISALEFLCENTKYNPVSILIKATSTISKVPAESVKKGCVVTFWMLNHSKETKNKLVDIGNVASFEISDNKIGISYNKNSNEAVIENDDDDEDEDDNDTNIDDNENENVNSTSSFKYNKKFSDTNIPLFQWVHVSLSFKIKENKTYCFLALNGVYQEIIRIRTPLLINDKTCDFTFYSSSKIYVGPYGIYPYFSFRKTIEKDGKKINDTNPLFTVDCRSQPKLLVKKVVKPIVYITPHSYNSTMKLEIESSIPDIDVKLFVGQSYDIITFVDALTERCGISVLLPLFAEIDLHIYEKNEQMKYIDLLIEVIKNLFSINPSITQRDFLRDKGFEILSHLLQNCSDENINSKLYNNLIKLFEQLTNVELKHQFLIQILTNMEIWIRCDIDSIKTSINSMIQLIDKNQKGMINIISKKESCFTNLLTIIRRYFFFKKKEESISYNGIRFRTNEEIPNETISELRSLLINLLRKIIDIFGINDNNFIFLLAQIFTAAEEEQRDDLITVMIEIANKNMIKNDESLLLMTYLINTAKYSVNVMNVFALTTTKKKQQLTTPVQTPVSTPTSTPTDKSKSKHKDKSKDKDKKKDKNKDKDKKKDKKKDKNKDKDDQVVENEVVENDDQVVVFKDDYEPKHFLTPSFLRVLVQVIIRTITPEFLTDTTNVDALKGMAVNPAFFPIITYCGLNNGKLNELVNAFTELNSKLIPEKKSLQQVDLGDIYDYDFWYFWLVASLYIGNESQIQFLIRSPSKFWVQIFIAIDFIGRIILDLKNQGKIRLDHIKKDSDNDEKTIRDTKRNFIVQLWASGQVSTKEKASDFLYLCKLYLFYHVNLPKDNLNLTLAHLKQEYNNNNNIMATPESLTASSRKRPAPRIPSPLNRKTEIVKVHEHDDDDDLHENENNNEEEPNIPLSPLGRFGSKASFQYLLNSPAQSPVQSPKLNSSRQIFSPVMRSNKKIPKLEGRKVPKFSPSSFKRNSMSRRSVTMPLSITLLNSTSENMMSSQQLILQTYIDDNAPSVLSKPPDFNFRMILSVNPATKMNQWADIVLVEHALKIWAKFHDTNYDDTALLIMSFLPPNKREEYLKSIDFQSVIQKWKDYKKKVSSNEPNDLDDSDFFDEFDEKKKVILDVGDPYLNDILNTKTKEVTSTYAPFFSSLGIYNAVLKNYQPKEALIGGMTEEDFIPMVNFYIRSLNKDLNIEYKKFLENYTQKAIGEGFNEFKKVKGIADTEISQLIGSVNQVFITDTNSNNVSSTKVWYHFWRQMTMENAPWFQSLPQEHRKREHYKRDMTGCFCFCPFRERKNFKHNDHMMESLARDTGNKDEANEMYNKFIQERKDRYAKSQPPEIFNVIDEGEDDQEDIYSSLSGSFCNFPCEFITISKTEEAIFYIREEDIVINNKSLTKIIPFDMIRFIFKRTFLQQSTAIEIFLRDGDSLFVNFPALKAKAVLKEIEKFAIEKRKPLMSDSTIQFIQNKRFQPFFNSFKLTEAWVSGMISNFEYLMMLNVYSGRSFNNASQYPLMPWILTDYISPEIHFDDEKIYRDLSKPIGALNPERLDDYISDYKSYESEGMPAFMYSSAPISPLSLFLYLIRQEPFTTLHTEMQGGRFDNAARLFLSIKKTFDTVTSLKGDFRELIPEFFFLPEFLQNKNHFNLGKVNPEGTSDDPKDATVPVNDVELPPWASSPIDFIYKHRKALESKYVSSHLHEWIDLIWGVKQNSFEANNVYKPQMYKGIWKTELGRDIMNRPEIEAILTYVGQIPAKLFNEPHPVRAIFPRNGVEDDTNWNTSIFTTLNSMVSLNVDFNVRILGGYLNGNELITIDDKGDFILAEINFDEIQKQGAPSSTPRGFGFRKRFNSNIINDKNKNNSNARGLPILNLSNVQNVPSASSAKSGLKNGGFQNFIGNVSVANDVQDQQQKMKAFSLSDDDQNSPKSRISPSSSSFLADEISFSPFFKSIRKTKMNIFSILHQSHPPESSNSSNKNSSDLTVTVTASAASSLKTEDINLPDSQLRSTVTLFLSTDMVVVGNAINDIFFISLNPIVNHNKAKGSKGNEAKFSFITSILKLMENRNEVVAIAAERQYIAAADLDAVLTVYDTRSPAKPLFSIPSFRESIKCIAVSQIFHLVVCGARESSDKLSSTTNVDNESSKKSTSLSSLLFCSINSRSFFKSVDLGEKIPNMVLLTICWGFTLVQTKLIDQGKRKFNLLLFSSNGEMIREVELNNELVKWSTFRTRSGFDYVVACDDSLNVFAFEAFYLNIKEPIFKSKSPVVDMTYLDQEEAISILTESGNLLFIPFKC